MSKETEDTYVGEDGILYCKNCHTKRERIISRSILGGSVRVPVKCSCQKEKYDKEEAERKAREFAEEVYRNRKVCFTEKQMWNWRFENADSDDPIMENARTYVYNWKDVSKEGTGLLLWGGVGSGKTYMAACIANGLLDKGYQVLMRNFNDISNISVFDQREYLDSLSKYDLLILDDLGVERKTEFAISNVFNVVDRWCTSGKPLIVTTNLSIKDLKEPLRIEDERIFDRVLKVCVPMKVDRESRRREIADRRLEFIKGIFGKENG